jgi:hypothetical protein
MPFAAASSGESQAPTSDASWMPFLSVAQVLSRDVSGGLANVGTVILTLGRLTLWVSLWLRGGFESLP